MESLFVSFLALGGSAALVAAIVNVAKVFGYPDGYANRLSVGLSLVAFAFMVYLKVFNPEVDIVGVDKVAGEWAERVLYLLGFAIEIGLPAKFHNFFAKGSVPLVGYSYSKSYYEDL